MNEKSQTIGHITALFTILVWGTTFISTKVLLTSFQPIEILFFRFAIGFFALIIFNHKRLILKKGQRRYFALAGLCGVTLYFLLENIALTYSFASNVGVIISIAPFFTAIFSHIFLHGEKLRPSFFLGFLCAMAGIVIISYNANAVLKLNPLGDILAVLASIVWAAYAVLTRKISQMQYNDIETTREIFFYGLLFMIPALFLFPFEINLDSFTQLPNLLNLFYLGLCASALCFVTWNFSVKVLGPVKTSVYIYLVPVITVVTSAIVLKEKITFFAFIGMALILIGLMLSEGKIPVWTRRKIQNEGTRI